MVSKKSPNYSLSAGECIKLLDGDANFYTYPELSKFDSIDEMFGNKNKVVLLYMHDDNYGHFTGLLRNKRDKTIYFFDSYNYSPDQEFSFIDEDARTKSNFNGSPYLSKLLRKSQYRIDYNPIQLQNDDDEISTCGRWVSMRLLFDNMTNDEFSNMMMMASKSTGQSPDDIITELTNLYL